MHTHQVLVPSSSFTELDRDAVYRTIFTRRDVRSQFLDTPISNDELARLLLAAHHAPSVGFMQPWSFVVVRDGNTKASVQELFQAANAEAALQFADEKQEAYMRMKLAGIIDAPINICVTCDRQRAGKAVLGRTHVFETDLYSSVCAVQNLWLAARSEGIGVGWVSIYSESKLKKLLNIPPEQVVIAYLCVGRVAETYAQPELATNGWRQRLNLADLIHYDQWQNQTDKPYLEDAITAARDEFEKRGSFRP